MHDKNKQDVLFVTFLLANVSSKKGKTMLKLDLRQLQYKEPGAISGSTSETAYEACKSGSITRRTQGEVKPIVYIEESLEEFKLKLIKSITAGIKHFEPAGEVELTVENRIHEIAFNNRALIELFHIKNHGFFIFEIEYQKNINVIGSSSESTLSPAGPLVKRFGINPEAISKAITDTEYLIPTSELHLVEKEVLGFALNELASESSTTSRTSGEGFAQNVVVVDIFARDGVKLKIDAKTNLPEIHAIVLWKESENKIALIDPTRRQYSEHIAEFLKTISGETLTVEKSSVTSIIYATRDKPTGQSEYPFTDPMPRDCIDIAVKIAFEINEQQKKRTSASGTSTSGTVPLSILDEVFKRISNTRALSKAVFSLDGTFIRELQSTDEETRKSSNQFLIDNGLIIRDALQALQDKKINNPSYLQIKQEVDLINAEKEEISQTLESLGLDADTLKRAVQQVYTIKTGQDTKLKGEASSKGKKKV
jgi:hypothetical protein